MVRKKRGPGQPRKKRGPGRPRKKPAIIPRGPNLGLEDRIVIETLLKAGKTAGDIAVYLGRSRQCVYREIKRGQKWEIDRDSSTAVFRYNAHLAQEKHEEAQKRKGAHVKLRHDRSTREALERYVIEENCSPYAAIERARQAGELLTSICVKTFYNLIHRNRIGVTENDLLFGFRSQPKQEEEFEDRGDCKKASGGRSISERPKIVLKRLEFGHWEGDLIVSCKGSPGAVLTLVERKTRFTIATLLADKTQSSVVAALDGIERRLGRLFSKMFLTLTFDNGPEFLNTIAMMRSCIDLQDPGGTRIGEVYYAHPYCSGERGTNENANRMIRRKFPKGTDFSKVSEDELQAHIDWINNYPRFLLHGRSSIQAFSEELVHLAA